MRTYAIAALLILTLAPCRGLAIGLITDPSGPTQYLKNKAPTQVRTDSVTPANNLPLPVQLYDQTGIAGDVTNPLYVQGSISANNPSVSATGAAVPASATFVGGENPSGDLIGLKASATGELLVDGSGVTQPISAASLPLPTGAATEATLSTLNGKVVAVDTGAVVVSSSALPTGAATSANQATEISSLSSIDGKTPALVSGRVPVDGSGVTQPVSLASVPLPTGAATEATLSALNAKVTAVDTGAVVVSSSALPTGAATETTVSAINSKLANDYGSSGGAVRTAAQLGNASGVADFGIGASGAQTLRVSSNITRDGTALSYNGGVADANTIRVAPVSHGVVTTSRNNYASTPVTTGAWVQLIASTASAVNMMEIFDSSGQTMEIGTGAAASETRLVIVFPGGNGQIPVNIPAGTRVSVRAVSASASVGELDINFYN